MTLTTAIEEIKGLRFMTDNLELQSGWAKRMLHASPYLHTAEEINRELEKTEEMTRILRDASLSSVIDRICLKLAQVKDIRARYWYMIQCITNHWTIRYLQEAIKLDDYGKHGALANNFTSTLPTPEANEVQSMLKDPYIFDMLTFTDQYNERDVEIGLVKHMEKFLIEMGAGFAFMGRQYHLEVSGDDYYIDMLMYNTFLHRYMVIELKDTEFRPEHIGKLNFYCSAVDDLLCREGDNPTIGLLLCKTKDRIKAEYALRDIQKPIGISDYELGQALPKDFRGSLPTIEEIENEVG